MGPALRRPWLAYTVAAGFAAILYVTGPLDIGPVFNALGASSAIAVAVGARRNRPHGRGAWYLIALGQALFVAGDVLAYNYQRLFGQELPFPSIADPLYLAMYPCLTLGLLMLVRRRQQGRDRASLIDAVVVAIGFGTLSWAYLMAPYAHDGSLGVLTKLTSLAYPMMDLLVLGVAARLVMGAGRPGASARMLAGGLVFLLVTDSIYGWLQLHGGYSTGGLLDAGWIASYVLLGAAALHPSMRELSERADVAGDRLTRGRLALFAATSLIAPVVQSLRYVFDQPREPVISVASGALFVLVLARLAGLVRAHDQLTETTLRQRFEGRLAALVRHANDLVAIVGPDATLTYVSPSAGQLLGRDPDELVGRSWSALAHPEDATRMRDFLSGLQARASGAIEVRLAHADGGWRSVETLASNLLDDPAVEGIVLNTRDVSERKALEQRLTHQAFHDDLTSLANRALLHNRVERALARARRHGTRLAVAFLDLDEFKAVNDTVGHATGDAILRVVAGRLETCVRSCDTAARLGGDEFALLLDGIRCEEDAVAVADRVIETIGRPIMLDGREFLVTPSVGIAFDAPDVHTADALLRNADAAMYLAKDEGKARHAAFQPAMHAVAMDRLRLKGDLKRAVEADAVSLVYQPIVDIARGAIVGVEALARWNDEERGAVSPAEFVPLAEQTGLIVPLGRRLLEKACHEASLLAAAAPDQPPLTMAVNVSARQLQAPDFVDHVRGALDGASLEPSQLMLELTESVMMNDVELAIDRLSQLRELGVTLAIDDFGTGYSSLNAIRRFPIDVLKIDRSFIQDLAGGAQQAETLALTATIVELARTLGLQPLAEGIEDAAQLRPLRELGCTLAQGFHLHRPMEAASLHRLLRSHAGAALHAS